MKADTIFVCIVLLLISLSMSEVLLISPSVPKVMAQPPSPPCVFYGRVYVGGKPAQDGLVVTAVIAGTALSWTKGTLYGNYSILIPNNSPAIPGKNGGVSGDIIKFYVHGINTNKTATFVPVSAVRLDLSIPEIHDGLGGLLPTSLSLSLSSRPLNHFTYI